MSYLGTAGNTTRATSPLFCIPCPPKTFASSKGSYTCKLCPSGYVTSREIGSEGCKLCESGSGVDTTSGNSCVSSLKGALSISSFDLSSGALTIPSSSSAIVFSADGCFHWPIEMRSASGAACGLDLLPPPGVVGSTCCLPLAAPMLPRP